MITQSFENGSIHLSGDTYTVRHTIRKLGGLWIAPPTGQKGGYWKLPDTAQTRDACAALVAGSPVAEPVESKHKRTPAPAKAQSGDAPDIAAALAAFVAATGHGQGVDADTVRDMVAEALEPFKAQLENRPRLLEIEVKRPDAEPVKLDGLAHYAMPRLIRAVGAGLNVWLAGPSGSGKTHGAAQCAKALGLPFYFHGSMTMAHELTGFVDGAGQYHETAFVRAFRNGGLVLLDELDAGSNEALLALNAPLANRLMSLPNGEIIEAHCDFRCIGAANTWGAGATAEYVGRTRIDAAFLQRFGSRLQWGYDEGLETAMSGNAQWAARVQRARKAAQAQGLKVLITPRHSQAGAVLIAAGATPDEAAEETYLADLSPDQRRMIGG